MSDPVYLIGVSALMCGVAVWLWSSLRGLDIAGLPRAVVVAIPIAMVVSLVVDTMIDARTGSTEPTVVGRLRSLVIVLGIPAMTYVVVTRRGRGR